VDAGLINVGYGCARFGDYDGDGDLDVVVTGQGEAGYLTQIYRNDRSQSTHSFTPIPMNDGVDLAFSAAGWGDVDDDGDLDLVIAGGILDELLYTARTFLLENHGGDSFETERFVGEGLLGGSVAWGDVDLDGSPDVLVTGAYYPAGPRASRVYLRESPGLMAGVNLPGTLFGEAAFGDYDADGDLDLVMSGITASGVDVANLYVNTQRVVNAPPDAPEDLTTTIEAGRVVLQWSAARDDLSDRLTYNLRIGTTEGNVNVMTPIADLATGRRYLPGPGNVSQNRSWPVYGLAPGTYWWSVQAIDAAYAASSFSASQSFTVPAP
jgi:hypothetical protein